MRIFRFILPLVILAASVLGFMLLKNGGSSASTPATGDAAPADSQPQETAWDVHTVTVELQDLTPQIVLHGRFETPRETQLSAAISADVLDVEVFDGTTVKKDDVLVRLDDTDARLTLAQREADLAEVRAQMRAEERAHQANQDALKRERRMLALANKAEDRMAKLAKTQVGSESVLDDARSRVQSSLLAINSRQERIDTYTARIAQFKARVLRANAGIDAARRDIDRAIIRAPFNGRVTGVSVSPGERTRVGDRLVSVYDLDHVELRAQVPERYLAPLRLSQAQQHTVSATTTVDQQVMTLQFDRFAGKVARGRGGVDALFRLTTPDLTPDIGRTVSTTVDLPVAEEVCSLPATAMYGNNRVYTVDDNNRLRAVMVTRVGHFVDDKGINQLLVSSPQLTAGVRLVVSQIPSAVDGLLVNPIDRRGH